MFECSIHEELSMNFGLLVLTVLEKEKKMHKKNLWKVFYIFLN